MLLMYGSLFVGLLIGIVLLVGVLIFIFVLVFGSVVEYFFWWYWVSIEYEL